MIEKIKQNIKNTYENAKIYIKENAFDLAMYVVISGTFFCLGLVIANMR